MKKIKTMRIASILLIAVLMTTCAISGTFAKYVTSDNGSDSARVAKWGVTVDVTVGDDLATQYNADTRVTDHSQAVIAQTVISSTADKLLAPGTTGTLATATITGAPEVAVTVEKTATLTLAGWDVDVTDDQTDNAVFYCPLIITIDGTEFKGTDYTTAEDFQNAVNAALTATTNIAPNLGVNESHKVTWTWAFTGNDDVKDTALGDLATAPTLAFTYTVTVTQVD